MFVILRIYNLIHVKYEKLELEKKHYYYHPPSHLKLDSLSLEWFINNLAEIFLHYFYTSGITTKPGKEFTSLLLFIAQKAFLFVKIHTALFLPRTFFSRHEHLPDLPSLFSLPSRLKHTKITWLVSSANLQIRVQLLI